MKKIFITALLFSVWVYAGWPGIPDKQQSTGSMLPETRFAQIVPYIGQKPMMLEFGAESCIGCQQMGRLLYTLKQAYPKAPIYFVNIYHDMPAAKRYGVRMIPTQKFLDKNGKVVMTHIGVLKKDQVEKILKSIGVLP